MRLIEDMIYDRVLQLALPTQTENKRNNTFITEVRAVQECNVFEEFKA